jgi:hypothetical protein
MSNAMSRSKSRWKGALLATVATAAITPLAAKAQSLTVGITTNPKGSGLQSSVYIDPYHSDTLYVYATVTGAQAPSASYVDGLDYLYYNVNSTVTGAAGLGAITSGALASGFAANGSQVGTISAGSLAVGSTTDITQIAKPRASSDLFVSSTANSGSNIVVSGNSVSFLVETLTYKPTSAAVVANPSSPASPNRVAFSVSIPSVSTIGGVQYVPDNYFVGMPSTPAVGTSPSAFNTSTGYTASPTAATLTNALPGDANLDGTVNFTDFSTLLQNYNLPVTGGFEAADFNNDGVVNFTDFSTILQNYNLTLGAAGPVTPGAQIAAEVGGSSVPEPASLGMLALVGVGALARRRRV